MAALRRANLAQVLIVAACSSATPSTETNGVQGVSLLENLTNDCEPDCVSEDIAGAALAQGVVWLRTRAKDVRQNNNQGVAGTDSAQLALSACSAPTRADHADHEHVDLLGHRLVGCRRHDRRVARSISPPATASTAS